jgi:antitoxin (DNA-binding transcriptional repressor) of toxin-antitoxin stability system
VSAVNLQSAKSRLSELVDLAASGQDVLIGRHGRAEVRLTAVTPARPKVKFGVLKGQIRIAPDFDAPLSPAELAAFHGEPDQR